MPTCDKCGKRVELSSRYKSIDQFDVQWRVCSECKNKIELDKIKFNEIMGLERAPCYFFEEYKNRSSQIVVLLTLIFIGGLVGYLGVLSFNSVNLTEGGILIPIIFLVAGFALMAVSLFFYKRGIIYWGYLSPFIAHKAEREKNPNVFWFLLTTHFIGSIDAIILGFYAYFTYP